MRSNATAVCGHYNNLKEAGLDSRNESRILYLRNFNNWIKSNLIQNTVSNVFKQFKKINVLDLGSGKGGDQIKWAKSSVSHVTFLDIADVSVKQSEERFKQGRFHYTADFVVQDFTQGFSKMLLNRKYHLISCQFAFHYSFESYDRALTTITDITDSLLPGGYFIGSTVNAFELAKRAQESTDNTFGNALYKVSFDSDKSEPKKLFGEKYNFYLEGSVNCPEFMVYPPLLDRLAADKGLRLVQRSTFPQFYRDNVVTENGRQLISRIKAMQEFYINELEYLDDNEYHEAKKYNDPSLYNRVQTISKSEWEIIGMYDIFVYQKM